MPKVLVTDSLAREGLAILEPATGLELVNAPGLKGAELLGRSATPTAWWCGAAPRSPES